MFKNGLEKLKAKNLDLIVVNPVSGPDSAFDSDTNHATIIDASGKPEDLPSMSKSELADRILDRVVELCSRVIERVDELRRIRLRRRSPPESGVLRHREGRSSADGVVLGARILRS